jgi:hypothetical protein
MVYEIFSVKRNASKLKSGATPRSVPNGREWKRFWLTCLIGPMIVKLCKNL